MKTTTLTHNSYVFWMYFHHWFLVMSHSWNMEYGASTRQSYGLGRPGLLQRGPALRTLCPCVQVRLLVAAVPDMNSSLLLIVAALSPHS